MAEGDDQRQHASSGTSGDLAALLARVGDGDRESFKQVYDQTSAKLFGVCMRILTKPEEAEEAVQDVFVSVWHRAATFRADAGAPLPWLIAIARNRSVDKLRTRRPIASDPIVLAESIADPAPLAHDSIESKQDEARLTRCLDGLATGDAVLIRTAFYQGASYSDLAARASLPLGTVKSRIRRALLRLRECLQ